MHRIFATWALVLLTRVVRGSTVQIRNRIGMSLENIVLSERSKTKKKANITWYHLYEVPCQIHRDRDWNGGYHVWKVSISWGQSVGLG